MNQMNVPFPRADSAEDSEPEGGLDIGRLLAMVRRQLWLIVLGALIGLFLAIAYLATTPPDFTAQGSVLVEDSLGKLVEEVSPAPANQRSDATVLSEIEIVRSQRMAEIVSRDLQLASNADFMNPPVSLAARTVGTAMGWVRGFIAGAVNLFAAEPPVAPGADSAPGAGSAPGAEVAPDAGVTPDPTGPGTAATATNGSTGLAPAGEPVPAVRAQYMDPEMLAVLRLQGGLIAARAGRSYVINIGFRSHSPELAQAITNAYIRAYVADGLETSFDKTRQAAEWMQGRLGELEADTRSASLEAERFRAENGLTSTRGLLVTEQQVSDLNAQLASARGDAARASARLTQAEALLNGPVGAAIAGAAFVEDGQPVNPTLASLRDSYLQLIARERDIIERYGEDHPQIAAIRRGKAQQEARLLDELKSTVASFENAARSAVAREEALAASVSRATGQNVEASQSQVKLKELEQRSETLGQLYQTFLGRYEELSKQASFPIARVRTLSEAQLPRSKSGPSYSKAVLALVFLGAFGGAGIGALRELRERFLRTEDDVRQTLGLPFLGYLPLIKLKAARGKAAAALDQVPGSASPEAARMLASLNSPSSLLAESLRNVRVAADVTAQGQDGYVLGIVSVLPGEGKSTVAVNLAAQLAAAGNTTLLIDADLRKPSISRNLMPDAQTSLVDGILEGRTWEQLSQRLDGTNLVVIPNAMTGRLAHTSELLSSRRMREFIEKARGSFRYIVLDLPPMAPVSDARAAAAFTDGMLLVCHWGRTPRAIIRSQLKGAPTIRRKLLGAVLNQVDVKRLARYENDGGQGHFLDRYSDYHSEPSVGIMKR